MGTFIKVNVILLLPSFVTNLQIPSNCCVFWVVLAPSATPGTIKDHLGQAYFRCGVGSAPSNTLSHNPAPGAKERHPMDDDHIDSALIFSHCRVCSRSRKGIASTASPQPIYCYMTEQCFQAAQHNKIVSCPLHGNLGPYFIGSADGFVQLAHIAPDSV